MYEYVIIIFIVFFLIPWIYIKIKYPFWSNQPIFHKYDILRYWTQRPFYIQNGFPLKTKFLCDSIGCGEFLDLNEGELDKVIDFIQTHYVESDKVLTMINKEDLTSTLSGYSNPSYIGIYKDKQLQQIKKNNETQFEEKEMIVGTITCRAVKIYMLYSKNVFEEYIYFWDHLSVHRNYIDKNIGRNLIQTLERYQRINNKSIQASLFKQESVLCEGVVPLFEYEVHTYPLINIKRPPMHKFSIQRIVRDNIHTLSDFLYNITHNITYIPFSLCIFPETVALEHLISTNNLFVYTLTYKSKLCAFYFFKDPKQSYDVDTDRHVLECIGSISLHQFENSTMNSVFFGGFLHALYDIQKIHNNQFKLITFLNLGHNEKVIDRWKWKYNAITTSKSAFYLYNAVLPSMPFHALNTFVLL